MSLTRYSTQHHDTGLTNILPKPQEVFPECITGVCQHTALPSQMKSPSKYSVSTLSASYFQFTPCSTWRKCIFRQWQNSSFRQATSSWLLPSGTRFANLLMPFACSNFILGLSSTFVMYVQAKTAIMKNTLSCKFFHLFISKLRAEAFAFQQ